MALRKTLRKGYDGLALFAVVNLAVLAGVTTYAFATGLLDKAKIARISGVLRGAQVVEEPKHAAGSHLAAEKTVSMESSSPASTAVVPDLEIVRRQTERMKVELEQQLALANSMMVRIASEREELRRAQEAMKKSETPDLLQQRAEGLKKQIEIYEQLAPKTALEHLLGLNDIDQAAIVLGRMEPRKAKKIIEAAKTAEQSGRVQEILQRVQDVAPERSNELTAAGP